MEVINPATEEVIDDVPEHDEAEVQARLAQAEEAFQSWRAFSFAERAEPLRRAADLLREERDRYARLMTAEMGKPLAAAEGEVDKCSWVCDFYAEHAPRFLADEPVATDAARSLIRYQPLGPVLAIMPWNFPFWQVFRFAGAGPDGRQRGPPEARRQRTRLRPGDRGGLPCRRLPRGCDDGPAGLLAAHRRR